MAPSERTCSGRAIKDTPVAQYVVPGFKAICCVAHRPLSAVSQFLLALLVLYFEWTLWCCSQLWPYVGMGSLGTFLHWDSKAMSDAAKISPRVSSTCSHNVVLSLLNIHIIESCQINVAIDNPALVSSVTSHTTSTYLWKYVHTAEDVCHTENLQSNGCWCFSHLYKVQDGIQVIWVFAYCG